MRHYIFELAMWMLLIFLVGCVIGYLLRKIFGTSKGERGEAHSSSPANIQSPVAAEPAASAPRPAEAPASAAPVASEPSVAADEPAAASGPPVVPIAPPAPARAVARMERPKGLGAPREGKADPLQRISGIGPKNEKILHTLGFFHFDQIAAWTPEQISWVDDHLKFNGRIGREEWIEQSKLLAAGADEEFSRRYGAKKSR